MCSDAKNDIFSVIYSLCSKGNESLTSTPPVIGLNQL